MTIVISRLLVLVLAGAAVTGCSPVAPWERGRLAKPQMATEPHPEQRAVLEHIYRSREAAAGGGSARGGGCGCY